ncbi:MAG: hypothetical protein CHACPFDD_00133 [Phycisphaerae bacterium]|nr:hypothetical protein [Phycisphaerae bacterium]
MPDRFLRSLAARLGQTEPIAAGAGERRVPYSPTAGISVTLRTSTGATVRARAYGTELSTDEIRLIHGAFCHVGTSAVVDLPTRDGELVSAAGTVVHCKYLESRLYEIVVHWNQALEVPLFATCAEPPASLPQA